MIPTADSYSANICKRHLGYAGARMLDPKWLDHFKDSDAQFVVGVVCVIFLAVELTTGWPPNLPWWVLPLVWIVLLLAVVSLVLKFFGAWLQS